MSVVTDLLQAAHCARAWSLSEAIGRKERAVHLAIAEWLGDVAEEERDVEDIYDRVLDMQRPRWAQNDQAHKVALAYLDRDA